MPMGPTDCLAPRIDRSYHLLSSCSSGSTGTVNADRLIPAPDCGMKYMPRAIAFGKLKAMSDAAAMVRTEIS